MTPEQAGWAILAGVVLFGGELVVWMQGHLDRCRRRFVRQVRRELRSRAVRGGFGEEDSGDSPRQPLVLAGGDVRPPGPVDVALPPAPSTLVGAGDPRPSAPTRPQRVHLGGAR